MKVIATMLGYYKNKRVRPGQSFELLDEKHFSKRWMIKPEDAKEVKPQVKAEKTSSKDKSVI